MSAIYCRSIPVHMKSLLCAVPEYSSTGAACHRSSSHCSTCSTSRASLIRHSTQKATRRRRSGHRCRRIPAVSIRSPTFLQAAGMPNRIPQQMTITIRSRSIPASPGTGLFLYGTVRMSSLRLRQHSRRILRHGSAAARYTCTIRRSTPETRGKSTIHRAT